MRKVQAIVFSLSAISLISSTFSPVANAASSEPTSVTMQSDSITYQKTVYYSKSIYEANFEKIGYKTFPHQIWVTSGNYRGYIPLSSWYISPTDYVVTYKGTIFNAPIAPNSIEISE